MKIQKMKGVLFIVAVFMSGSASASTVAEYFFNGSAAYNASTELLSVGSAATLFQSSGLPAGLSVIPTGNPGANVVGSRVNISMQLVPGSVLDTGLFTIAGFNADPVQPVVSLYLGTGSGGTSATPVLTGTLSNLELTGQDGNNTGILTGELHPNGGSAFGYFSDPSDVIALNFDLTTNFNPTMYSSSFSGQINGQVQSQSTVPLPPAIWLLGSGALALIGISRWRTQTAGCDDHT